MFYTYERPNTIDDYAAVRVTYKINGENTTTLEIPFIRTEAGGGQTPVDITRNHLYTIVLGNGKPVTTNEIKFSFVVEDWNEVEMPEEIGPGDELDPEAQAALNAGLMVNMFTEYNAKEFDLVGKTITSFYESDTIISFSKCPIKSYVTWNDLKNNGALTAEFTGPDGGKYRLPTGGELALLVPIRTEDEDLVMVNGKQNGVLHPWWNDHSSTNTYPYIVVETPFTETIYLQNDGDHYQDQSHAEDPRYTLSGISQLKVGEQTDQVKFPADGNAVYDIHPVYGIRFKGTSQYAAYRWEHCRIQSDNSQERYLSIKIKALHPQDSKTTINDIAQESFWTEGSYIEFKFPASGIYDSGVLIPNPPAVDNVINRGIGGYCWSNTLKCGTEHAYNLDAFIANTSIRHGGLAQKFPLRFVKVDPQQQKTL